LLKCTVCLLFPEVFWDDNVDYFGHFAESIELRGEFYMFWNLHRCVKQPILIALMAGDAAHISETRTEEEVVQRVLATLERRFGKLPPLTKSVVTRWKSEP